MKKCQFMLFHRSKRKLPNILPDVVLDSEKKLKDVCPLNICEFYLDQNLRWNVHVGCILRKMSKYVPILYNVKPSTH